MRYEFISRCQVQTRDGFSKQRILLNAGIVCIIIAMVIELILNNKFALVFVVPLIYLISLRCKMPGKAGFRDVRTELVLSEDTFALTFFSSIMENGQYFDRQYLIKKNKIKIMTQERKKGRVTLLFEGIVNTKDFSSGIIRSQHVSGEVLPLFLPVEQYGEIIAWLEPQ